MCFDIGHPVIEHLNVSLDHRDLLRKAVVLAHFAGQFLDLVLHDRIGCCIYSLMDKNKPTAGRTKAIHRRLELSFNLYLLLLFVGQNRASKASYI